MTLVFFALDARMLFARRKWSFVLICVPYVGCGVLLTKSNSATAFPRCVQSSVLARLVTLSLSESTTKRIRQSAPYLELVRGSSENYRKCSKSKTREISLFLCVLFVYLELRLLLI